MLSHFNTWCIKGIRKNKSGPKKLRAPNFSISGAQVALEIFGLCRPLMGNKMSWSIRKLVTWIHGWYKIMIWKKAFQQQALFYVFAQCYLPAQWLQNGVVTRSHNHIIMHQSPTGFMLWSVRLWFKTVMHLSFASRPTGTRALVGTVAVP